MRDWNNERFSPMKMKSMVSRLHGMRHVLSFFHLFALSSCLFAYDAEIDGIYYDFISAAKMAYVTHAGFTGDEPDHYHGKVVVPAQVTYGGRTYKVVSIGENAFAGCEGLTSVQLPSGLRSVSACAFLGCTSLTSVTLPADIRAFGSCAFTGCTSLREISLPRHTALVDSLTLYCCASLTSLVLPHRVRTIGGSALEHLPRMTHLYCFASEPPVTEARAFSPADQQRCTLHVPKESLQAYMQSPVWGKFYRIEALTDQNYTSQNYHRGDVNDDGVVDATDLALLRRIIVSLPDDAAVRWAADVNEDGTVNAVDYVTLAKRL